MSNIRNIKYTSCPIHPDGYRLSFFAKPPYEKHYCLQCFAEFLDRNITSLTVVPEGPKQTEYIFYLPAKDIFRVDVDQRISIGVSNLNLYEEVAMIWTDETGTVHGANAICLGEL